MKLLALLFLPFIALSAPSDTVSVAKPAVLKSISDSHDELTKRFQYSLTPDQLRLQKAIDALEAEYRAIDGIAQDSIKVKK